MSHLNPTTTTATTSKPTIAFFGATGGCAGHALASSLRAGYQCTALVRNRQKLQTLLSTLNVSPDHLSNLTIIEGNIHSPKAVSQALQVHNNHNKVVVEMIISGLGSVPKFTPNPLRPTLMDPTICESGTRTILSCLSSLFLNNSSSTKRPLFITISTTGISTQTRDIPLLMMPLYHWMLPLPHKDKRAMERALVETQTGGAAAEQKAPISGFVVVRPSLLTDGPALGSERVRVGWEIEPGVVERDDDNETKGNPAIGYTISRADVGDWIFRELIDDDGQRERWTGKMVSLTY